MGQLRRNFAVQSHQPGGEIGQTRFILDGKCPGRDIAGSNPARAATKYQIHMKKEHSTWNGFTVNGDVNELVAIIESTGFINLNKDDVIGVLSAEGENWITTGTDIQLDEAFTKATNGFPFSVDRITSLLISFRFGMRQPKMAEISKNQLILSKANPDINVRWGITYDESLGDAFKVILVASANR